LLNFKEGVLLPDAINKTPETRGRIEIKIYPLTIILAYPFIGKFDPLKSYKFII